MVYVEVSIAKQHTGNKLFTYTAPKEAVVGSLVKIPFGRVSALGVVLNIVKKPKFTTKPITELLPTTLPATSLRLMQWMFSFYPDDWGLISQIFIPANINLVPKKQNPLVNQPKMQQLPKATPEQLKALKKLINSPRALLHGDTGTGKTRVFIEQANNIIADGKSVLILTPEIGLTPQLINELVTYVSAPVVVTHSSLTPVERRRVWNHAINSSEPTIYIGPRSALFLPIKQLGLVVIDEAHDSSYKQLQSPRYSSLHIAAQLATLHKAQLIQSTATPNTDEYEYVKKNNYTIIRMKTPAVGISKHDGYIIDITKRNLFTKNYNIADSLLKAISNALKNNEQILLFLNRRGSARSVQCSTCGWQAICPHCGIPLTYHHDTHDIRCHECNYRLGAPTSCPTCSGTEILFKTIGTKSLVQQVSSLFPTARIHRFDADNSSSDRLHNQIEALKKGGIDILIGTQLITKGIDLPYLSVVGVINADTSLNLPDYRAEEITFQQLYQAAGRVGRGHRPGAYFIQTRMSEHPVIKASLQRSWEQYHEYELQKRRTFKYPPFCFIGIFKVTAKTNSKAEHRATEAYTKLSNKPGLVLLGPSPSFYEKHNDDYMWQIVVKSRSRSIIVQAARELPSGWVVDIDPVSLL